MDSKRNEQKYANCSSIRTVQCTGCKQYADFLRILLQPNSESISDSLSEYEEELQFMRAVVWLKHVIASAKEISLEDFLTIFSGGHHLQNPSAGVIERSNIPTSYGCTGGDEYESQESSQASVSTIDLLFSHGKSRNNDNEKNMCQRQSHTSNHLLLSSEDTLTFVNETSNPENATNYLFEYNSSDSSMFDESAPNSAFNSMSKLLPDNTDYAAAQAGSGKQLTEGNVLRPYQSFTVSRALTTAASWDSLGRRAYSFTEGSSNSNNIIVNNCTSFSGAEEDDSAYNTMHLKPRPSKTKVSPRKREINCIEANPISQWNSSGKYRKVDFELPHKSFPEPGSPQRWNNDSSKVENRLLDTRIIPDSDSEDSSCSPMCSLGSVRSCLNECARNTLKLSWASQLSSKSSTLESVPNNHSQENVSAEAISYEIRDVCQKHINITPETRKSHSEGSSQESVDPNFSPISGPRSDGISTFRKSGINCPLSNARNNSKEQEKQYTYATRSTSRTVDFDGGDGNLFTPIPTAQGEAGEQAEKLSSAYLNFVLDYLNVDEATSRFIAVILSCFEDGRITRAYMKRRRWENTLEQEAVRTVLSFCYTVEAQTNTNRCTRAIVLMLYRSFDKVIEESTELNISEHVHHISVLLEFLCSKDVCIMIINHLILALKRFIPNPSAKQRRKSLCKLKVIMYALKICLIKYRLICADSEKSPEEITSIADSRFKQSWSMSKDIAEEDNTEEQEEQWIDAIENLSVILLDDFYYLAVKARDLKNILISK